MSAATLNKIFFFTDHFFVSPGDHYYCGLMAAPTVQEAMKYIQDSAAANGAVDENIADFMHYLEVGQTDMTGTMMVFTSAKDVEQRTRRVEVREMFPTYCVSELCDLKVLEEEMVRCRDNMARMTGAKPEEFTINLTDIIYFDENNAPGGKPSWRIPVIFRGQDNFVCIEAAGKLANDDNSPFELTGSEIEVVGWENKEAPLSLQGFMTYNPYPQEFAFQEIAQMAFDRVCSNVEKEGWERIETDFGRYTMVYWLAPNWKETMEALFKELHEQFPTEPLNFPPELLHMGDDMKAKFSDEPYDPEAQADAVAEALKNDVAQAEQKQ